MVAATDFCSTSEQRSSNVVEVSSSQDFSLELPSQDADNRLSKDLENSRRRLRSNPEVDSRIRTFESIFDLNGSSALVGDHISHQGREEKGLKATTLGYGEILPETIVSIILKLKTSGLIPEKAATVYDLGSGCGRVLFAAALAHDFVSAVGVEILESLHDYAFHNLALWNNTEKENGKEVEFQFVCTDFRDVDFRQANVIICHATLFDNDLMASIQLLAEDCPTGTVFIIVSKRLRTGNITGIETLFSEQMPMSWGLGTVNVQIKR